MPLPPSLRVGRRLVDACIQLIPPTTLTRVFFESVDGMMGRRRRRRQRASSAKWPLIHCMENILLTRSIEQATSDGSPWKINEYEAKSFGMSLLYKRESLLFRNQSRRSPPSCPPGKSAALFSHSPTICHIFPTNEGVHSILLCPAAATLFSRAAVSLCHRIKVFDCLKQR